MKKSPKKPKSPSAATTAKKAVAKATKRAGDKMLLEQAATLPAGQAKTFLAIIQEIDEINAKKTELSKRNRGCRARLKELKIELAPFDHVYKLRKMAPEDSKSYEASVALYKEQIGMQLDPLQKALVKEIVNRREAARDAMLDAGGRDTGREIGSAARDADEDEADGAAVPVLVSRCSPVPLRNEAFGPVPATVHH